MSPDFTLAFSICPPFSLSTSRGGGRRAHRSASVRKGNIQDGSQDLTPTRPPLGGGSAGEGVKGTRHPTPGPWSKLLSTVWVARTATSEQTACLWPK